MPPLLIVFVSEHPKEDGLLSCFSSILTPKVPPHAPDDSSAPPLSEEGSPFLLCTAQPHQQICAEHVLLVCHENCTALPTLEGCKNITIILSSQSQIHGEALPLDRCRFLTYGFSSRDTITISSITEEMAVISIQRRFSTFGGHQVEPMELLISGEWQQQPLLLPIVTALIFCEVTVPQWKLPPN